MLERSPKRMKKSQHKQLEPDPCISPPIIGIRLGHCTKNVLNDQRVACLNKHQVLQRRKVPKSCVDMIIQIFHQGPVLAGNNVEVWTLGTNCHAQPRTLGKSG